MVKGKHLLEEAYRTLYQGSTEVTGATKVSSAEHLVAINPTPGIIRREVIPVCLKTVPGLRSACAQVDTKKTRGYIIAETPRADVPVANITGLFGDSPPVSAQETEAGVYNLQNSSLSMTIKGGRITSIFDRIAERELIADGLSAGFVIYRDHPRSWDAWEVDISHLETRRALKFSEVNILEKGPVRATIACVIDDGSSKIEVQVRAHGGESKIDTYATRFTLQISLDAIAGEYQLRLFQSIATLSQSSPIQLPSSQTHEARSASTVTCK